MTLKEVKSWASSKGYSIKKLDVGYSWFLVNNPSISGQSKSISTLAVDIYNHITNNAFVDYQQNYRADD